MNDKVPAIEVRDLTERYRRDVFLFADTISKITAMAICKLRMPKLKKRGQRRDSTWMYHCNIAHRFSTLQNADQIALINSERIFNSFAMESSLQTTTFGGISTDGCRQMKPL